MNQTGKCCVKFGDKRGENSLFFLQSLFLQFLNPFLEKKMCVKIVVSGRSYKIARGMLSLPKTVTRLVNHTSLGVKMGHKDLSSFCVSLFLPFLILWKF